MIVLVFNPLLSLYFSNQAQLQALDGTLIAILYIATFGFFLLLFFVIEKFLGLTTYSRVLSGTILLTFVLFLIESFGVEEFFLFAPPILIFSSIFMFVVLWIFLVFKINLPSFQFQLLQKLAWVLCIGVIGQHLFSFFALQLSKTRVSSIGSIQFSEKANPKLVVHLLLDEFSGDLRDSPVLGTPEAFFNFYPEGQVYTHAYSRALGTADSVDQLFGAHFSREKKPGQKLPSYFDELKNQGFEISFFLADPTVPCTRYTNDHCFDQSYAVSKLFHSRQTKEYLQYQTSQLLKLRFFRWRKLMPVSFEQFSSTTYKNKKSLNLELLKFAKQKILESSKRDSYIYIHLLVPHPPYHLNENCEVTSENNLWSTHPKDFNEEDHVGYKRQVPCANRLAKNLLDFLKTENLLNHAKIIIQGDHGARFNSPKDPACTELQKEYLNRASRIFFWIKEFSSRSNFKLPTKIDESFDMFQLREKILVDILPPKDVTNENSFSDKILGYEHCITD